MKTLWRGREFFASFSNNARGVCILVKDEVNADVELIQADDQGNLVAAKIKLGQHSLTVVNIYSPNSDDPSFYVTLKMLIRD